MSFQENNPEAEENLLSALISRFMPFWPLFALLILMGLMAAWAYLKMATPIYEASATLIIKDENKGVENSQMLESIDPFDSKKILENEIEVIQSRTLMEEVVKELHLYAPIFEEKALGDAGAYSTSPIIVEFENPDNIPLAGVSEPREIQFSYNSVREKVLSEGKEYPLNKWVDVSGFGKVMFKPNEKALFSPKNQLYYTLINPRIVTKNLLANLEANPPNKLSSVVRLALRDDVPQRGKDVLNSLISAYYAKAVAVRNSQATNTLKFIEERMKNVEAELKTLESEIQEFRSTKGVVDLSEQGKLYLSDMGTYDRQIATVNQQMAVLDQVEGYIQSNNTQGGIVPSSLGVNDPGLTQLLNKLYDSEIQYEKLRKTTAENNPILSSVSNEIQKIRPSILENVQNQKNNLRATLGNLNYNSGKSRGQLKAIPEKERELLEISRRKAIKSDLFSFLQQKREETALTYAPSEMEGQIVDLAESSLDPVSPKRMIIYAIGMALAFIMGVLYVVIKEFLNRRILFRSEIERFTKIPIIAELPNIDYSDMREMKKQKPSFWQKMKDGLTFKSNMSKDKGPMLFANEPGLQDNFRQMGAVLGLYSRNFSKKKILITSNVPGEGKSFISRNLANCLSKAGKKVALFDADFVRCNTSRQFDLLEKKGTLDYLSGNSGLAEIVNPLPTNKNLSIIPAGIKNGDHTDLLLNGKLDLLFEYLGNKFDFIILDAAPMDLVADVNLLAEYSDKTLLVVRHAITPKSVLKNLRHSNMLRTLKNVSIVFNGVKKRGLVNQDLGYGYGYKYGNGYGYEYLAEKSS